MSTEKNERLMSLDALRGADMLCIIGGATLVIALCKLFGFGEECWLAQQMTHVTWHGFRHHDTIFPLFLFLAGVSWPFSYAHQRASGRSTGQILGKVARRMVALILLGLVTKYLFMFDFAHVRWCSVLAHIGCCWAGAAVLYMFVTSWKARLGIMAALLVGHWAVLYFLRAPDAEQILASTDPELQKFLAKYAVYGTGNFSFAGSIAGWVDRMLAPGKLYEVVFDPEGLLGKVSGVVTAALGVCAGELLRRVDVSGNRKTVILLGAGAVCLGLCWAWEPWCPINKKLWTATFILAAGAYSFFMLALFYWIIDVKGLRKWTFFFRVIGMNSITIYLAIRMIDFNATGRYFLCGVARLGGPEWEACVLTVGKIAVEWIFLWYLYRNRTFLKV